MTGIEYRTDAETILEPHTRERMLGGGSIQLITVQLSDTGYHVDQDGRQLPPRPAVRCELRASRRGNSPPACWISPGRPTG